LILRCRTKDGPRRCGCGSIHRAAAARTRLTAAPPAQSRQVRVRRSEHPIDLLTTTVPPTPSRRIPRPAGSLGGSGSSASDATAVAPEASQTLHHIPCGRMRTRLRFRAYSVLREDFSSLSTYAGNRMCVRTRPQPTQERGAGRSSRMPEYDLVLAWPTRVRSNPWLSNSSAKAFLLPGSQAILQCRSVTAPAVNPSPGTSPAACDHVWRATMNTIVLPGACCLHPTAHGRGTGLFVGSRCSRVRAAPSKLTDWSLERLR
jgi:hypothetical protein